MPKSLWLQFNHREPVLLSLISLNIYMSYVAFLLLLLLLQNRGNGRPQNQDRYSLQGGAMPPFCYVSVVNKLDSKTSQGAIENVVVCFAESMKVDGMSYLSDFRWVDIETERNVLWKKSISFEGCLSAGDERKANEKVYFGNNRNYWQVYFKHNGENYKMKKNNAMFNLHKSADNAQTVTIEIRPYRNYIYVNFKAPSGEDYFYTKKENRRESGISVTVKNLGEKANDTLPHAISDVCVLYIESNKNGIEIEKDIDVTSREFVRFDNRTVKPRAEITSTKRVKLHYQKGYWQVYITYDNEGYKLEGDNLNFDLSHDDNGRTLFIAIQRCGKNPAMRASFKTSSQQVFANISK